MMNSNELIIKLINLIDFYDELINSNSNISSNQLTKHKIEQIKSEIKFNEIRTQFNSNGDHDDDDLDDDHDDDEQNNVDDDNDKLNRTSRKLIIHIINVN